MAMILLIFSTGPSASHLFSIQTSCAEYQIRKSCNTNARAIKESRHYQTTKPLARRCGVCGCRLAVSTVQRYLIQKELSRLVYHIKEYSSHHSILNSSVTA